MSRRLDSAYGSNPIHLWYYGLRDRLTGRSARANARWGHVHPPQGSGKVIWIKTGAEPMAVRLAVEIMGAIRQKRLDVRLVLTFEEEHTEILKAGLKGFKKIGFGFGPCDAPRAVKRVLARLQPLGVIIVDQVPGRHLLGALQAKAIHSVSYAAAHAPESFLETFYPINKASAEQCRAQRCADHIAVAADPVAVLTQAQVEPTLGSVLRGGKALELWWYHGPDQAMVRNLPDSWRRSDFDGRAALLLSSAEDAILDEVEAICQGAGMAVLRLSQWQREEIAPGTVVLIDEAKWMPAVAVSVEAIHINQGQRSVLWQALASGAPVSLGNDVTNLEDGVTPRAATLDDVFRIWRQLRDDRLQARRSGDACRKRFWDERRRAMAMVDELLQRVYDW